MAYDIMMLLHVFCLPISSPVHLYWCVNLGSKSPSDCFIRHSYRDRLYVICFGVSTTEVACM